MFYNILWGRFESLGNASEVNCTLNSLNYSNFLFSYRTVGKCDDLKMFDDGQSIPRQISNHTTLYIVFFIMSFKR